MARLNLIAKTREQELCLAYLEANASDTLAEKINGAPAGSMTACWSHIVQIAKKKAGKSGSVCMTDEEVFGLCVHYFEEELWKDDKKATQTVMDAKAEPVDEDEEDEEEYALAPANADKATAPAPKAPKRDTEPKPKKEAKKVEKAPILEGQMSLFDMLGGGIS